MPDQDIPAEDQPQINNELPGEGTEDPGDLGPDPDEPGISAEEKTARKQARRDKIDAAQALHEENKQQRTELREENKAQRDELKGA